jgi:hypothetical protein
MTIDVPPHDSGSQPTLAFAPFSPEDLRRIREWQSTADARPDREEAAGGLRCCDAWMDVGEDGLHCRKCGKQQDWVPGVVLEIDLTGPS